MLGSMPSAEITSYKPTSCSISMAGKMDLRCPNCNSADLKSLSVAFQEGRFSVNTSSRLGGVVVGEAGPDVVVARAKTRGVQQSELSKKFSPPAKWSYGKVLLWSALISLVALIA